MTKQEEIYAQLSVLGEKRLLKKIIFCSYPRGKIKNFKKDSCPDFCDREIKANNDFWAEMLGLCFQLIIKDRTNLRFPYLDKMIEEAFQAGRFFYALYKLDELVFEIGRFNQKRFPSCLHLWLEQIKEFKIYTLTYANSFLTPSSKESNYVDFCRSKANLIYVLMQAFHQITIFRDLKKYEKDNSYTLMVQHLKVFFPTTYLVFYKINYFAPKNQEKVKLALAELKNMGKIYENTKPIITN